MNPRVVEIASNVEYIKTFVKNPTGEEKNFSISNQTIILLLCFKYILSVHENLTASDDIAISNLHFLCA